MNNSGLRIFSYLPNPRVAKATIAAQLCNVEIEIVGAKPAALKDWLWDFDARPLTDQERAASDNTKSSRTGFTGELHKTEAFMRAQPYGTVPAGFSPDGSIGIFESNSIVRTVARLGANQCALYGEDAYSASRIDSFLGASLIFACASQAYLLALMHNRHDPDTHQRAAEAFAHWIGGVDRCLNDGNGQWLVGEKLSLADICVAAEFVLLEADHHYADKLTALKLNAVSDDIKAYPSAQRYIDTLLQHPAFSVLLEYRQRAA